MIVALLWSSTWAKPLNTFNEEKKIESFFVQSLLSWALLLKYFQAQRIVQKFLSFILQKYRNWTLNRLAWFFCEWCTNRWVWPKWAIAPLEIGSWLYCVENAVYSICCSRRSYAERLKPATARPLFNALNKHLHRINASHIYGRVFLFQVHRVPMPIRLSIFY